MIIEKIKEDLKKAIKEKDETTKNFLRVVIGEAQREKNQVDDNKMTSILKTLLDNAMQMGDEKEAEIVKKYMPKLLSEEEISSNIDNIIEENGYKTMADMGNVMKIMKEKFGSSFDGKVASSIAKEKLGFDRYNVKKD